MGRRGISGRRRQLIQLDNTPKTSYLTQTGCYRPDDIFIESKNVVKSGLSLVCDYTGSDSESEEESDKGENDSNSNQNGDISVKNEDVVSGTETKDNLHAEMLGIVGTKVETPSDIFRREFNAYQRESAMPSYSREFIAFQKETSPSLTTSNTVTTDTVTTATAQPEKGAPPKEDATDPKPVSETLEDAPKTSDIDSQVASFLAEIDALGDDTEVKDKNVEDDKKADSVTDSTKTDPQQTGGETEEVTKVSEKPVSVVASYKSSGDSCGSEEEQIEWPEEPVSEWQQCHDEGTQHYYYWNINTNEVTWEIPAEFTQYLLLYKEYELTLTRLIKEGKKKPKKKKIKPKRDLKKKKSGGKKCQTPVLPTEDKVVSVTKPSEAESGVTDKKEKSPSGDINVVNKLSPKTSSPDIAENIPSSENLETVKKDEKSMDSDNKVASASPPVDQQSEIVSDKHGEDTTDNPDDKDANTTQDVNCNGSSSVSAANISDLTIEMCKKKFKAHKDSNTSSKQDKPSKDSCNTPDCNRETSAASDSEHSNIDIDEVDRQLELALERKVNELRRLEEEEKLEEVPERQHIKRKHKDTESGKPGARNSSEEEYCVSKPPKKSKTHKHASKRAKEKKESSKKSEGKKRSSHKDHQSKKESRSKSRSAKNHSEDSSKNQENDAMLKENVTDLNQLIMDKMEFLEIDINKPSKLQVLLVQFQTRSSDWQAGGLSTSYFFERLQEANEQIIQFEKSGAPAGWSVCWDRNHKRYYYCNLTTDQIQWDYPEQQQQQSSSSSKEESSESKQHSLALSSTLPPPPPPTPPPPPSMPPSTLSSSSSSSSSSVTSAAATGTTSTKTAATVKTVPGEINTGEELKQWADNWKKEKKIRKLEKLSSKCSKPDSISNKSHLEQRLHISSSKDFESEVCVYPGEPPPPGTEVSKRPPLQKLEEMKLSKSVEEDLEEVMKLAAVLGPAGGPTSKIANTTQLEVNNVMQVDENVAVLPTKASGYSSTPVVSSSSNGHPLFPIIDATNCIQNNSAVISKPPQYKSRPAISSDSVVTALPTSNLEGCAVNVSKSTTVSSVDNFYISKSSVKATTLDSSNTSNCPVPPETNDSVETVKPQPKEKKRKKDKVISSTNLTLKKKNVSSLVQKWQKVKKEVEKEDELAGHEFSDDD